MAEGIFITFEGIDGVGKSTQAGQLRSALEAKGHAVIHTREPGGTRIGAAIRRILLDPELDELQPQTEILLYAADRAQHAAQIIRPALVAGQIVICERFIDSSLAYQGYGLGWDRTAIASINGWAVDGLTPSLTIYLDQEPEQALKRAGRDRIEQRTVEYYQKVRSGFLQMAQEQPARYSVIKAGASIAEVSKRVLDTVQRRLTV